MSEKKEEKPAPNVKQEQIHGLLFGRELGWQEIIYDLINSEQLDPWDINITILTDGYLAKIENLEEADFFVSSKVLLAAALLLRIKSEILLNKHIQSIDDILFGKKEEKSYTMERIELDEEIPELIPRSPIPRLKQVTLNELIEALNKAITTENRRIKKEIINKNALREVGISLPKRKINIKDKIKEIYSRLFKHFDENKERKKIPYSEFIVDKEEKIISFYPLLQLENQRKVWMQQDGHFEEIFIWMKKTYLQHNPDPFADLKEEIENEIENMDNEQLHRKQNIDRHFDNPLREMFGDINF
jgi:segregation and condensation protein A